MKQQWRLYQNYIIIALLSIVSVFFLPMLGSSVGLGFTLPDTFAGWTVYLATKACIVVINILIFDQFVKQGKVNVKDDPRFLEAERILSEQNKSEEEILPAPYYIRKMYKSKVTTTGIFTILGVFGFTNALLTFDWVSMLSYTFTIIMGLVFGWISMNQAEEIWVEKHYRYAKKVEREAKEAMELDKKRAADERDVLADHTRRADILESNDSDSISCDPSQSMVVDSCVSCSGILGDSASGNTDADGIHTDIQKDIQENQSAEAQGEET